MPATTDAQPAALRDLQTQIPEDPAKVTDEQKKQALAAATTCFEYRARRRARREQLGDRVAAPCAM
jgi:hypothetical protein